MRAPIAYSAATPAEHAAQPPPAAKNDAGSHCSHNTPACPYKQRSCKLGSMLPFKPFDGSAISAYASSSLLSEVSPSANGTGSRPDEPTCEGCKPPHTSGRSHMANGKYYVDCAQGTRHVPGAAVTLPGSSPPHAARSVAQGTHTRFSAMAASEASRL